MLLFFCFWKHCLWLTVLLAITVIFEIEMLVHTRYIVTPDEMLKIESGRFVPNIVIPIEIISRISRSRSRRIFKPALSSDCLEIEFGKERRKIHISPKNAEDFVLYLTKRNSKIRTDILKKTDR